MTHLTQKWGWVGARSLRAPAPPSTGQCWERKQVSVEGRISSLGRTVSLHPAIHCTRRAQGERSRGGLTGRARKWGGPTGRALRAAGTLHSAACLSPPGTFEPHGSKVFYALEGTRTLKAQEPSTTCCSVISFLPYVDVYHGMKNKTVSGNQRWRPRRPPISDGIPFWISSESDLS